MKNFVKELLTNRFGIVLATLNVCYFVSRGLIRFVFEHVHGEKHIFDQIVIEKCFFSSDVTLVFAGLHLSEVMQLLNLPALLFSLISNKFINIAFPDLCFFTISKLEIAFILFFITVQWLFIAWLARKISQKLAK